MAVYEIEPEYGSSGRVFFRILRYSEGGRETMCRCDTRQQAERAVLAFNALDYMERGQQWTT